MKIRLSLISNTRGNLDWIPKVIYDKPDIIVLAGNVIESAKYYQVVERLLKGTTSKIVAVDGPYEHYGLTYTESMSKLKELESDPRFTLLDNSYKVVAGMVFYGGNMWSSFNEGSEAVKEYAAEKLLDFTQIKDMQRREGVDKASDIHNKFIDTLGSTKVKNIDFVVSHFSPIRPLEHTPLKHYFNSNNSYLLGKTDSIYAAGDVSYWLFGNGDSPTYTNRNGSIIISYPCADYARYSPKLMDITV